MLPFLILSTVEAATAGEKSTSVRFLGHTFNVSLIGAETDTLPEGAEVLGTVHTGQVLLAAFLTLEGAVLSGDGKLCLAKELSAETDTSKAYYFALNVEIKRV